MKIVADDQIPFIKEYFAAYGELVLTSGRSISPEEVKDADMLLVRSITRVDEKLLANSSVKFVGSVTAGADHLDTKWLDQAGILWTNAHGFNALPVADYVMSVIAALQRKKVLSETRARIAVIGVGNVGRLVVERLKLLDYDVVLCDPLLAEQDSGFQSTPLAALADLDLITLHVPLTRSQPYPTHHFIDKDFLQRQKPECVLLNTSRGAVIKSADLLQYGTHLYWCFDVWEHEPNIEKEILARAFIATPHIAGYSIQSKLRGIDMIYRIACEKHIIEPQPRTPIDMPRQQLQFAGEKHHWQDIVLGVFNPIVMTAMMRTLLLPAEDYARHFDEMRNGFNYRYEFAYTSVAGMALANQDIRMLARLGVEVG